MVWGVGRTCSCTREEERSRESGSSLGAGQDNVGCRDGRLARGMEGQRDGRRDRGIEGWREGRTERKRAGCFPSPLHKAHAGTSRNLLKEGTCLGALAWAGELQGLDPQCSLPGTPPSPFLPWLWASSNTLHTSSASFPHPCLASAECGAAKGRWRPGEKLGGGRTHSPVALCPQLGGCSSDKDRCSAHRRPSFCPEP